MPFAGATQRLTRLQLSTGTSRPVRAPGRPRFRLEIAGTSTPGALPLAKFHGLRAGLRFHAHGSAI